MSHPLLIIDNFYAGAQALAEEYQQFLRESGTEPFKRMVWDFFEIPSQCSYIRTFAERVFTENTLGEFRAALCEWALSSTGCNKIQAIWLSNYLDGNYQATHTDSPLGPLAFVYSLTDWNRRSFTGGRTYFLGIDDKDLQFDSNLHEDRLYLAPEFNRLVVFDGSIPHGVESIGKEREFSRGRVVLHGIFSPPTISVSRGLFNAGGLQVAQNAVSNIMSGVLRHNFRGLLSVIADINESGFVTDVKTLVNNVVDVLEKQYGSTSIEFRIHRELRDVKFPKHYTKSKAIIPFIF